MTHGHTIEIKAGADLFSDQAGPVRMGTAYSPDHTASMHRGDCLDLLGETPDRSVELAVTSPPYNIGKSYEQKLDLDRYVAQQRAVIHECVRVLKDEGSICWQVGNYVEKGAIIPLDTILYPIFAEAGLRMRNRIVWHFEHGLHCTRRFSGRYEVIMWFTKTNDYIFNLDPVRVPQKYPGKKHFKGERAGEYSSNPKGKNPGDVWIIPNVKHNHVEKTPHPCQFPVELIERLVLSMTNPGGVVLDPFMGVGSACVAAIMHGRRAMGAEIVTEYYDLAWQRVKLAAEGRLRTRPMGTPVYKPSGRESVSQRPLIESAK